MSNGKRLIEQILDDSYYPDHGSVVSAESVVNAIESDPLLSSANELLRIAKLVVKEWEAPTEGVQRGELIARLSQYADEARRVIKKVERK